MNFQEILFYSYDNPKFIIDVVECEKTVIHKSSGPKIIEQSKLPHSDFNTLINILKKRIIARPNSDNRVEHWECKDVHGKYNFSIQEKLLKARR